MNTKLCRGCNAVKTFDQFAKASRRPDGLQTQCKACSNAKRKAWDLANPDRVREQAQKKLTDERSIATRNAWRNKNRDIINARGAAWAAANRDKYRQMVSDWDRRNKPRKRQLKREREGLERAATPTWADFRAMQQYYVIAKFLTDKLGIAFHVDHVVPVKSDIVCGLHSHTNLSIALGAWNIAKHNRYWPDMPDDAISPQS